MGQSLIQCSGPTTEPGNFITMPGRLGIYFCNNLFFFSSHGWKKMTVCKNHRSNAISDLPVGGCDAFNIDRRLWWGAQWSQCISFFVCLQIFLLHILISKLTHRVFLESARLHAFKKNSAKGVATAGTVGTFINESTQPLLGKLAGSCWSTWAEHSIGQKNLPSCAL